MTSVLALPDGVALRRATRRVLARVVLALRVVTLAPVAVGVVAGIHAHDYTSPLLASVIYLLFVGWLGWFGATVWRRGEIDFPLLVADLVVVATCVLALAVAVRPAFFVKVTNSDLESAMVVAAVTAAMHGTWRWAAAACAVLVGAHAIAELPATIEVSAGNLVNTVIDALWLVGAALVGGIIAHRLLAVAEQVDSAASTAAASTAAVAEERARLDERMRHHRERLRHYRALHDGPLSILTGIANGGLDHNAEDVRRQCAINANLLRGLIADDATTSLSDLAMSLTEAGSDYAIYGIRILYQFANLPTDVPDPVIAALAGASREALNNVAAHADTDRVWLTAVAENGEITVTIADRGKGFDRAITPPGRGIDESITGRLAEVGGSATVLSHPGEGSRVELRWPA